VHFSNKSAKETEERGVDENPRETKLEVYHLELLMPRRVVNREEDNKEDNNNKCAEHSKREAVNSETTVVTPMLKDNPRIRATSKPVVTKVEVEEDKEGRDVLNKLATLFKEVTNASTVINVDSRTTSAVMKETIKAVVTNKKVAKVKDTKVAMKDQEEETVAGG
jgi:hypothetical protein